MRAVKGLLRGAALAAVIAACTISVQAQLSDSGTISLTGNVSGYVEIRAGGPASLTNNSGGGITNNKNKADHLNNPTALMIDFGEVGPSNNANFVTATVPIRLRSNVAYTLRMSVTPMTYGGGTPDASSVLLSDVGFGVISAARDSGGGVATGVDTVAAGANGDPRSGAHGAADPVTGRYVYSPGHSLGDYTSASTIVSGPRIMNAVVPTGGTHGLVVTTAFAVKPQFFTPGSFSTSVTFTISNP